MYFGKRLKGRSAVNIAKPGTPYEVKVVLYIYVLLVGFHKFYWKKAEAQLFWCIKVLKQHHTRVKWLIWLGSHFQSAGYPYNAPSRNVSVKILPPGSQYVHTTEENLSNVVVI